MKIFFFFWVSKISIFWQILAQKARTKKHYKNRGFRALFFWKADVRHETLDQKIPNSFQLSFFFACFIIFQQHKTQKLAETPIFIVF